MSTQPKPDFYKVEKDVPIPPCTGFGRPSKIKAAFLTMQVSDSFLAPEKSINSVRKMARKLGFKLATRKDASGIRRIWRVK